MYVPAEKTPELVMLFLLLVTQGNAVYLGYAHLFRLMKKQNYIRIAVFSSTQTRVCVESFRLGDTTQAW